MHRQRKKEGKRVKWEEEKLLWHTTNLALRSSWPVTSFLFSTNGNLLLTTIMLPLEEKLPGSVDILMFSDQLLQTVCSVEEGKKWHREWVISVARLHTRGSLLFLFGSCSIRTVTGSAALFCYTKCRVSRAITCACETEVEGKPRQLDGRSG